MDRWTNLRWVRGKASVFVLCPFALLTGQVICSTAMWIRFELGGQAIYCSFTDHSPAYEEKEGDGVEEDEEENNGLDRNGE